MTPAEYSRQRLAEREARAQAAGVAFRAAVAQEYDAAVAANPARYAPAPRHRHGNIDKAFACSDECGLRLMRWLAFNGNEHQQRAVARKAVVRGLEEFRALAERMGFEWRDTDGR